MARILWLYGGLTGLNIFAWGWALAAFHGRPALLGTAILAYGLGLRHAVDADHVAAIDNVTRKLMQEGKRPVAAGLFFSLGHSTVVILLSTMIATTMTRMNADVLKEAGGIIGTSVPALFLFVIGTANLLILVRLISSILAVRRGERLAEEDIDGLLAKRGFLSRWAGPIFGRITQSWWMYPLGFLFGLGFDTATEIGLLGISAAQSSQGMPVWQILVFPALFTAGMSLADSTDGVMMLGAYGWAYIKPLRKLYYNMAITSLSVITAFLAGGVEVLGGIKDTFGLEGMFWDCAGSLNGNFSVAGFAIAGVFLASWGLSALIHKFTRYDKGAARSG